MAVYTVTMLWVRIPVPAPQSGGDKRLGVGNSAIETACPEAEGIWGSVIL